MVKFLHPIYKRLKSVGATPEHQAFLEAIDNQLNELEDDVKLMVSEMQIKKASGGWLDAWGDWYGVKRPSRTTSDDEYREFILREVTKPRNTIPGIVEEIERHLPEGSTVRVHEPYVDIFRFNISEMNMTDRIQDERYTRHAVIDIIIDGPLPPYLADIVHEVKAAGIKVYFTRDSSIWDEDEDGNLTHVRMYSLIEPKLGVFTHTHIKVSPMELFYFNRGILNDSDHLIGGRPWVVSNVSTVYELYTVAKRQLATSRNTSFENIKDVSMDEEWLDDYFDAVLVARTLEMYAEDVTSIGLVPDFNTVSASNLINLHTPHIIGDSAIPIERYFDVPVHKLYDHGERGEAELYAGTPIMDGLVLWYDFSLKDNYSPGRERATDLSGNGNHGTLQNFNFTPESGYGKNELLFDGVDDHILSNSLNRDYIDPIKNFNFDFVLNQKDITSKGTVILMPLTSQRLTVKKSENTIAVGRYTSHWFGRKTPSLKRGTNHFSINVILLAEGEYGLNEQSFLIEMYVNGTLVEDVHATSNDYYCNVASVLTIGWQGTNTSQGEYAYLNESLHSLKIYNRSLTPEEVAHNYAIEKERFGIE